MTRRPFALGLAATLVAGTLAFAPALARTPSVDEPPSEGSVDADLRDGAPFAVGTGLASVHPEGEVCLGGYAVLCGRTPAGTMDELFARGLAVTGADDETVVLVTVNSYGWFAAYKELTHGANGIFDVRQRIAAATGVPATNIVVQSDHSHATPDTTGTAGGVDEAYLTILADGAVQAGVEAVANRVPAVLSTAVVEGPTLESSYARPPVEDADTDSLFRVLFADTPAGERIATFPVYSTHATVCSKCSDLLTGDWTSWSADIAAELFGGAGFGAVGTIGATDWRKRGDEEEKIAEAKQRLRDLLLAADATRTPVVGDTVAAELTFLNEPIAQPLFLAALANGVTVPTQGDLRIDRSNLPPFHTGSVIGTFASALRIGDTLWTTFPGEPFPQLGHLQRDAVQGASVHFVLGASNDFLGYMVADLASYQQTFEEGALFLPGCPEEELYEGIGQEYDGACPGHWQLMVSPTMGRHAACTGLAAAARLDFLVTTPDQCAELTVTDGLGAPTETGSR